MENSNKQFNVSKCTKQYLITSYVESKYSQIITGGHNGNKLLHCKETNIEIQRYFYLKYMYIYKSSVECPKKSHMQWKDGKHTKMYTIYELGKKCDSAGIR